MDSSERPNEIGELLGQYPVASLYEAAFQTGALPSAIKPLDMKYRLCGRAVTVHLPPANNLWLHGAVYEAGAGDVLIASTQGGYEAGYWGELMAHAAIQRGIAGVVIDGCVRDGLALRRLGLPVFARGQCVKATSKDPRHGGLINFAIVIGGVVIRPGDWVIGDDDGVIVTPQSLSQKVLRRAKFREEQEARAIAEIREGKSTLEIFGWRIERRRIENHGGPL